MVAVLVSCAFTHWGRPRLTAGGSKALVLVGRDTTVSINVLGTFRMALENERNGGGGLGLTSMTPITIQPSAWTQLLFLRSSQQWMASRTYLWSRIKAHKAHAEVNRQSHEVALHDAGVRLALRSARVKAVSAKARQGQRSSFFKIYKYVYKSQEHHQSSYQTTEL